MLFKWTTSRIAMLVQTQEFIQKKLLQSSLREMSLIAQNTTAERGREQQIEEEANDCIKERKRVPWR